MPATRHGSTPSVVHIAYLAWLRRQAAAKAAAKPSSYEGGAAALKLAEVAETVPLGASAADPPVVRMDYDRAYDSWRPRQQNMSAKLRPMARMLTTTSCADGDGTSDCTCSSESMLPSDWLSHESRAPAGRDVVTAGVGLAVGCCRHEERRPIIFLVET